MDIIDDIVLNLILMIFPILVYFIYNCYRELRCEKYNSLLFNVALITSMYLYFKHGNLLNETLGLLFCNLPIIVAYLKKKVNVAVFLSFLVVFYVYFVFNMEILILLVKLVGYFILYIIGKKRKIKDNTFILLIAVLQGFFLSFEFFYNFHDNNLVDLLGVFFMVLLFYILPFILLYLFKLADNITSLHITVSLLEKEKQIKNSLFKITHEVKNPIAVCSGYLEMLDVHNSDQVQRYIPIIKEEIARSLDIMSDFMEFSKIKIVKEIMDVNLLVEDVLDELKILMNSRDIDFNCKLIRDEIYIEGDYNRLKQVFINMIKNSLEAIDGKGSIKIIAHILGGQYYIEIIDSGCGMDVDTLNRVKEMFFTTKVRGSGLGVSLSNEIIKAHNGCLDYYSKVGNGTKVVVKLPIVVL